MVLVRQQGLLLRGLGGCQGERLPHGDLLPLQAGVGIRARELRDVPPRVHVYEHARLRRHQARGRAARWLLLRAQSQLCRRRCWLLPSTSVCHSLAGAQSQPAHGCVRHASLLQRIRARCADASADASNFQPAAQGAPTLQAGTSSCRRSTLLSCTRCDALAAAAAGRPTSLTTGRADTPASSSSCSACVRGVPCCTVCSARTLALSRRAMPGACDCTAQRTGQALNSGQRSAQAQCSTAAPSAGAGEGTAQGASVASGREAARAHTLQPPAQSLQGPGCCSGAAQGAHLQPGEGLASW